MIIMSDSHVSLIKIFQRKYIMGHHYNNSVKQYAGECKNKLHFYQNGIFIIRFEQLSSKNLEYEDDPVVPYFFKKISSYLMTLKLFHFENNF